MSSFSNRFILQCSFSFKLLSFHSRFIFLFLKL
nr:MAG TPA: hypothetical protein [Caudoviricetes sp.]